MKYLVDNNNIRFQSKRNLKHLNLGLLICGFKCTLYSHLRYNNKRERQHRITYAIFSE